MFLQLDIDFIHNKAPGFLQRDLIVGDHRHLILFSDRQPELLACAKIWYMDDTFHSVSSTTHDSNCFLSMLSLSQATV